MLFTENSRRRSSLLAATLCLLLLQLAPVAHAQQQQQRQRAPEQTDDVIRITTELVQTDVMVFDKQGRFVDGLRPEDFELQINGKPQAVSFFERVAAGSHSEEAQLAAARSGTGYTASSTDEAVDAEAPERGRLIFFFLDDLHMSGASLILAREALQRFVDKQMNANDQVAIVSTSGQIGFLQQLTDNPTVLRAAIKRLNYKQNPEAYTGSTHISEYMASQILDNGNRELYAYLLESIKVEQQMGPGIRHGDHRLAATYSAAPYLANRLRQVNSQGRMVTADTLAALRSLMLSSATLPGRKLVFFLSDGFLINERKSGALETLHKVTEDAARAGAVVYTMDLRGAFSGLGSGVDASTNDYIDLSARRVGVASGEINATREPLKLIADATGGRAIFNSNSIDDGILQAIRETSSYYLLAWRPDSAEQRETSARLKVVLKGHPELHVRLRTNTFSAPAVEAAQPAKTKQPDKATAESGKTKAADDKTNEPGSQTKNSQTKESGAKATKENGAKTTGASLSVKDEKPVSGPAQANDAELLAALGSLYPRRQLPVSLSVGFLNTSERKSLLKVSMQMERSALEFDPAGGGQKSLVDVMGVAIDDRGQFASFKQLLTITPDAAAGNEAQQPVIWHQQLQLKPGLYQVRVALRERTSGRTGSSMQWVEIPDLSKGSFYLSSIFLGERPREAATSDNEKGPRPIIVDVDHRFARSSVMRFQTYIYNAAQTAGDPSVVVQAEVFRGRQQVTTSAKNRVPVTGDVSRLPYWSEIALERLPPGRYLLQLTATDQRTNASSTQRVNFSIE